MLAKITSKIQLVDLAPYLIAIVFFTLYTAFSILKHAHFNSYGYDLGIFDQAIWHYSQFQSPASTIRGISNILGDHFSPIIALLAPLFWIWNNVKMLLIAQSAALALSIIPVYLFCKKRLGIMSAILFAISYGIFWGIQDTVAFDFHEVAIAVPAIAFGIYFMDRKCWKALLICLGIILLTKEDLSLLVAFFGIYLLYIRQWKIGIGAIIGGVAWFFIATKLFIPFFASGMSYGYWTYTELGATPLDLIRIAIFDPKLVISTLFNPGVKLHTMKAIFLPFGFLAFGSPLIILAIPLIAERFLSTNSLYWVTDFHYTATISPIVVMASADGLSRLAELIHAFWRSINVKYAVILPISIIILALNLHFVPRNPLYSLRLANYWVPSASDQQGNAMLKLIPQSASVTAQDSILPHLTHRIAIYQLGSSNQATQYVAANINLPIWPTNESSYKTYLKSLSKKDYSVIYSQGGWLLFEKTAGMSVPLSSQAQNYLE